MLRLSALEIRAIITWFYSDMSDMVGRVLEREQD